MAQKNKIALAKIFLPIIDITLIFWAFMVSYFFFISSIFEFFKGNIFVILVYLLALIFLIIHFLIRQKYPAKFIRRKRLPLSEKFDNMVTDILIKSSTALASSVAIFIFIYPQKLAFFINEWQVLAEKAALTLFISIACLIIISAGIPLVIVSLAQRFLTGTEIKKRIKLLAFSLYLLILVFISVHSLIMDLMNKPTIIELLVNKILQEDVTVNFIRFLLGIPLIFWLESLLFGIDWLKIDI